MVEKEYDYWGRDIGPTAKAAEKWDAFYGEMNAHFDDLETYLFETRAISQIEEGLEVLYELFKKERGHTVVINSKQLSELRRYHIYELDGFHTQAIAMVERDDTYFCGIRAEHFVVEIGWSEHHEGVCILVTANHKGYRVMTYFVTSKK